MASPLSRVAAYLTAKGHSVVLECETARHSPLSGYSVAAQEELEHAVDLAIVLGGDGTMAVINLVSEAMGVTSSAALAYIRRPSWASRTSTLADAKRSLPGSGNGAAAAVVAESSSKMQAKTMSNDRIITPSLKKSKCLIARRDAASQSPRRFKDLSCLSPIAFAQQSP